jgi:hypothetical protein
MSLMRLMKFVDGWLISEAGVKGGRWKRSWKTVELMYSRRTSPFGSDGGVCKRTKQTSVLAIRIYR